MSINIKQNAAEIKRRFFERQETTQAIFRFLLSKGISAAIAHEILSEERQDFHKIEQLLSSKIKVTGELTLSSPKRLVFVGPTGVGKTTTLLKLAIRYQTLGFKVAVTTLDICKRAQLQESLAKLNIPLFEEEGGADLTLIDTEGCNFYLPERVDEVGMQIANLGFEVEVILVLSASAKEVDLYGAVHQFSSLCPSSLLFTKLDETLASGTLMNVMAKTDLPVRYVAYGYPMPGEVEIAHPEKIVHKILTDFNKEEFNLLRQLTLSKLS